MTKEDFYDATRTALTEAIGLLDDVEAETPMQTVRLIKVKRELGKLLVKIPVPVNPDDFLDIDSFFTDID